MKMSRDRKPAQKSYKPTKDNRGYQPQVDTPGDPNPQGGYTPISEGDNLSNPPKPPSEE